ncbi:MAG: hypothetical protein O3C55_11135 [Proteobacteria bacterium]|nr:hypothetical protein [Pseudomonadota bacterium]
MMVNQFHLVEDWETLADQQACAAWRGETGGIEILDPLLTGGVANLRVTICGPEQLDV